MVMGSRIRFSRLDNSSKIERVPLHSQRSAQKAEMKPVDQLEITILVDNTTDSLSSNPDFVETEFAFLRRHGMKWLSGKCLCCAAHGLSCLITARSGAASHTLLFDTGPDEWVFERNVTRLGADRKDGLGAVGAL